MKRNIFLFAFLFLLLACKPNFDNQTNDIDLNNNVVDINENSIEEVNKEHVTLEPNGQISHNILRELFFNINKEYFIKLSAVKLKFYEDKKNIFKSQELYNESKPKHWLHVNKNLGIYSNITFSTTDLNLFKQIVSDVSSESNKKESISTESDDIANKYYFDGYTIITYEPKNGINVSLNHLYQIVIQK